MKTDVYEVRTLSEFDNQAKRFVAKKRFFSLPDQIEELKEKMSRGQFEGDLIRRNENPAYEVYKLRLPNPDVGAGKSNGYRVYYLVASQSRIVVFMCIYYKKEHADMPDVYINGLIDGCLLHTLPEEDGQDE